MLEGLRRVILQLAVVAQQGERARAARLVTVLAARFVRAPGKVAQRLAEGQRVLSAAETEHASWISAGEIREGRGGPFDACDLRHWLAVAERAGVPAVPAREILALDPEDHDLASGKAEMPDGPVARGTRRRAAAIPELAELAGSAPPGPSREEERARLASIEERLHAAMDGVPEGWMVRYARCGSTELKALAGAGAVGREPPEVRFGPGLEVGPGWVRNGNRRAVFVRDTRTVRMAAEAPPGPSVFLARPWVEAARYAVGPDPHRHGTQFAGKGVWPAEWRAFVEDGRVVGVAWYYGWCGAATPADARIALRVRDLARRMADACAAAGAWPRDMRLEWMRSGPAAGRPEVADMLARFPREGVSCTLDFIEAREGGLTFLEGGPPCMPNGGGHPVAFAGCGGEPGRPGTETAGVAFRLMPGVLLADPGTWVEGDRSGCVLTWEEAEALAAA